MASNREKGSSLRVEPFIPCAGTCSMSTGHRKRIFFLKLAISIFFLYVVFKSVDLQKVSSTLVSIDMFYFLILILISAALILVSCLKWQLLLRTKGLKVSMWRLSLLYMLGYFFNNFLPGMIGGDLVRGFFLARQLENKRDSYLSIFMERITGFFTLILLTLVIVLIGHPVLANGKLRLFFLVVSVLAGAAVMAVFSKSILEKVLAVLPARFARVHDKCRNIHEAMCSFNDNKAVLVQVLGLSFLYHILTGLNLYYACLTLNYSVGVVDMIVVAPLIIIVSLVPITPNQLGLWEGSFVVFFSLLGIPGPVALSAALLTRLKSLLVSILGGLVYWGEDKSAKIQLKASAVNDGSDMFQDPKQ